MPGLDSTFASLADPTRRGILEHLGRRDASISDLAAKFEITLTGIKKHVQILERSQLVTTAKLGRVRTCTLGPRRLGHEAAWIAHYRQMLEAPRSARRAPELRGARPAARHPSVA